MLLVATIVIQIKSKTSWEVTEQKEISDPVIKIGRSDSNDIVIKHRYVSRKHATLFHFPDKEDYEILDGTIAQSSPHEIKITPSSCGVEVNGIRIEQGEQRSLKDRDVIVLVPEQVKLTYLRPTDNEILSDIEITYIPPELLE